MRTIEAVKLTIEKTICKCYNPSQLNLTQYVHIYFFLFFIKIIDIE